MCICGKVHKRHQRLLTHPADCEQPRLLLPLDTAIPMHNGTKSTVDTLDESAIALGAPSIARAPMTKEYLLILAKTASCHRPSAMGCRVAQYLRGGAIQNQHIGIQSGCQLNSNIVQGLSSRCCAKPWCTLAAILQISQYD